MIISLTIVVTRLFLAMHFIFISLQIMKNEHAQLSHEAHACAESIPELNKMVTGVQALGRV